MKINQIKKELKNTLLGSGIENPSTEADYLLCFVLKCDRAFLYTHESDEISDEKMEEVLHICNKRSKRIPFQYITGRQEFMSIQFKVQEGVLIPRPDTEILVEESIEKLKKSENSAVEILDIGTGTGCIAISIAKMLPQSHVVAVDISAVALEIATINAANTGVKDKICFLESDIFSELSKYKKKFDAIISNPPYIPSEEIDCLMDEVSKYEPRLALDGGHDGLKFYREIASKAVRYLKDDGFVALEVGASQAEEVSYILSVYFDNITIFKDYSGIDRVVMGWNNNTRR
jgi:release factor glutamine methyltransferase